MKFKQYGYTPENFKALVDASGLSNTQFFRDNNISEAQFYRYKNGDTSIPYPEWKKLVEKYGGSIDVQA